jgi:hypothetical protein
MDGTPFFVMEKAHGQVAVGHPLYSRSCGLVDTVAPDRHRIWESAASQLASIQLVSPSSAPFLA